MHEVSTKSQGLLYECLAEGAKKDVKQCKKDERNHEQYSWVHTV